MTTDGQKAAKTTKVYFRGGPWDGNDTQTVQVTAPVFAVGHEVGNHYWLDTKSDPPTYVWDGTEWAFDDRGAPND